MLIKAGYISNIVITYCSVSRTILCIDVSRFVSRHKKPVLIKENYAKSTLSGVSDSVKNVFHDVVPRECCNSTRVCSYTQQTQIIFMTFLQFRGHRHILSLTNHSKATEAQRSQTCSGEKQTS